MSSDCTICNHPLVDHGYSDKCECCSGRMWTPEEIKKTIDPNKPKLPKGFRVCPDFPDYMVNKWGTVRHIASGKFCLLIRLSNDGLALIHIYKNGRRHMRSAQELRHAAFGEINSGG